MNIIQANVMPPSTVYSDGYQAYENVKRYGYAHESVDHEQNEYGRGEVNTNSMESFWGLLKRRLKITGGIRVERLHEYVAEETWRFNHRNLTEKEKIERFINLLKKIGG